MKEPDLEIYVAVAPCAKANSVSEATPEGGRRSFKVRVTAPPADGKANLLALALLARHLGIPPSSLRVVRGASARKKIVRILS